MEVRPTKKPDNHNYGNNVWTQKIYAWPKLLRGETLEKVHTAKKSASPKSIHLIVNIMNSGNEEDLLRIRFRRQLTTFYQRPISIRYS